jgi:hypothetical protein
MLSENVLTIFDLRIQSVPTLWLGFLKELHCSLLVMSSWWGKVGSSEGGRGGEERNTKK